MQAAADAYGVRVCIITTYEHGGYLEITPLAKRSERSLWLSLHAEVHYNSICACPGFDACAALYVADQRVDAWARCARRPRWRGAAAGRGPSAPAGES